MLTFLKKYDIMSTDRSSTKFEGLVLNIFILKGEFFNEYYY